MSYLVLARKWRPQTFEEVVGQAPVVRTLKNALARKRVAHAMLFSGVRGVGKTTLARIMAKALNCTDEGAPPCNGCESCKDITEGSAVDLHEIDGASNRGIQEIRELKENIRFFPVQSRYKIIIIDEVHMLTTEAFNALLKTLEEPPEHVFFMFATTELHKVPVTILSRCQRYELKRIQFEELTAFFRRIADAEKVTISDAAIGMIAREAEGSVRDGLSLLDQIFSFSGNTVSDEDVTQVLGLVDRSIFESLAKSLLAKDLEKSLDILEKSYNAGLDLKRFTTDLLRFFRALLVCKTTQKPEELLDASDLELASMKETAASHSPETLYQVFQLLLKGIEEMQYSTFPRMTLEMAFIKIVQAGSIVPVSSLLEKLDNMIDAAGGISALSVAPVEYNKDYASETPQPLGARKVSEPVDEAVYQSAPHEQEIGKEEQEEIETVPTPPEKADVRVDPKKVRENWDGFIDYVMDRKKWMAHVLRLCSSVREEDRKLILKFDDKSDCKVLQEPGNMKLVTEYAQDFFQKEIKVKISIRGLGEGGNGEQEGPQEERRALGNDPLVQMTTEVFGGQVVGIRTGPRSR